MQGISGIDWKGAALRRCSRASRELDGGVPSRWSSEGASLPEALDSDTEENVQLGTSVGGGEKQGRRSPQAHREEPTRELGGESSAHCPGASSGAEATLR